MGAARKRRRLVAVRTRIRATEELGRFGWLVGAVVVFEVAALIAILGLVRPL